MKHLVFMRWFCFINSYCHWFYGQLFRFLGTFLYVLSQKGNICIKNIIVWHCVSYTFKSYLCRLHSHPQTLDSARYREKCCHHNILLSHGSFILWTTSMMPHKYICGFLALFFSQIDGIFDILVIVISFRSLMEHRVRR